MRQGVPRAVRLACSLAAAAALLTSDAAAGPYDPALRFRTHRTAHFEIHFHQGEEALAARLGAIAEAVRTRVGTALGRTGPRAHVVLVDQTDISNGLATVVPWNAIVIYAAPPSGADTIGNTDDWLEYVFTHEYAHVVHLDRSNGWARIGRGLFGRTPLVFPNLTLPLWQIEGLATLIETGSDGHGRLHAGEFRAVVDRAAADGSFEPLDRVSGGLVDWPSGQGWYAYGARFHEYLVQTYGRERLIELSERTAGRLPFLTSGAFRAVYGKPLGELWRDFRRQVEAANTPPSDDASGRRLTALGFLVDTPREGPDGSIYFSASDARRFPAVFRLEGDGYEEVVTRFGGTGLAVGRGAIVFDQLELARGVALLGDLYAHSRQSGSTRRLTSEARLGDPDLSHDGTRLAVTGHIPGGRSLMVLDAATLFDARRPAILRDLPVVARAELAADVIFASPRWSPDGTLLAAERRVLGGPSTIVLLDGATLREVAAIVSPPGGRFAQPAWTPDGATLLFSAADADEPFEIRAVDVGPGGRVTQPRRVFRARGGARAPLVTRDGRLIYVGYTTSGFDLFEVTAGGWPRDGGAIVKGEASTPDVETAAPVAPLASEPYRPWPTLAPRAWEPRVESRDNRLRLGAGAIGGDVLGRHVVGASATWALSSTGDDGSLAPRSRPDWDIAYAYQRWQPTLYLAASDRTSLFDVVDPRGAVQRLAQRERTLDIGVWRAFRRVRWAHTLVGAYHVEQFATTTATASADLRRAGLRTAWTFNSAKRYGYSISQEAGVTTALTAEWLRPALGADGSAEAVTADVRAYLPIWPRHAVLAARLAGASSSGDREVRRRFRLGGTDGNPLAGAFGNDAVSLLRGFQDDVFVGEMVGLFNLEARLPIASVQRGWGTWPVFLRAVHGAAFTDIGHAWSSSPRWRDRKIGYGAELSADVVLGYGLPLTLTGGVAWGDDGAGLVSGAREIYFRVGRSF